MDFPNILTISIASITVAGTIIGALIKLSMKDRDRRMDQLESAVQVCENTLSLHSNQIAVLEGENKHQLRAVEKLEARIKDI